MSDYKVIKGYTIDRNNELHKKSVEFLNNALETTPKKAIIISHHLPLYYLIDTQFKSNVLNEAYASNLAPLVEKHMDKISYWVYGHCHILRQDNLGGINFVRNPLGYLRHNEGKCFQKELMIEI
jgi:hypothetical protein